MPNPRPPGRQPSARPKTGLGAQLLTGVKDWALDKRDEVIGDLRGAAVDAMTRIPAVNRRLAGNAELRGALSSGLPAPSAPPRAPAPPAPRIDTGDHAVVVVGGAADGYVPGFDIAKTYAGSFSQNLFLTHLEVTEQRRKAVEDIKRFSRGRPVILVGHSLGGPGAYSLVSDLQKGGVRVPALFTMDGVGGSWGRRPDTFWVNVRGASAKADQSDWVAGLGRTIMPSSLPGKRADIDAVLPRHHGDLDGMMRSSLNGGPSAEEMIGRFGGSVDKDRR